MSADVVKLLWINAGLSCDGESVAITSATQPAIEDLVAGIFPGVPALEPHWPLLATRVGTDFLAEFHRAERGELDPFLLVVEGSIPNEEINGEGFFAAFGDDEETGQPRLTTDWIDALVPHAWAVIAIGTCATYGGIPAMAGNPTGAMGLPDHLGWSWTSPHSDIPIVCIPGCPTQPDNMTEVLLYLLRQHAELAPMIPLDSALRPTWLYGQTVHEVCDRAGYYEQGIFADGLNGQECIVKQGCWGPVVMCNVPKRGWINGIGGCPNVGGICIGCTMPGFPDKFMPFMDEPPGGKLSTTASRLYGAGVRKLREFTRDALDDEPAWRTRGQRLLSGYVPPW